MKKCNKCKNTKEYSEFYTNSCQKDGYAGQCKTCDLENKKDYQIKNRELISIKKKEYYKQNKKEIIYKGIQRSKKRYKNDINYRLREILRGRIRSALKNNSKSGSAVQDLGCSVEKLKLWIEMNWQDNMSWDNYGPKGWHIDHIIPLASFDLTNKEQFLKAVHFTNLQPLWAEDNYDKKDKLEWTKD